MVPVSHSHSSRRWHYTSGVLRVRDIRRHRRHRRFRRRNPADRHDLTAYARRGTLDNGSENWSVPGLHKIPAHLQ